jgi:hypothetical protein
MMRTARHLFSIVAGLLAPAAAGPASDDDLERHPASQHHRVQPETAQASNAGY